jgi:hypothetical protein
MNQLAALILAAGALSPALAVTDVGISIGIMQPGVYGRIDIGAYPQPLLFYPEPVVIAPAPIAVYRQPIYLYVPPAHRVNWRHYCGYYHACSQPVYFVQEKWVRERYEHEHPGWHGNRGRHRGHGRD